MSYETVLGVVVRCDDCHAAASRQDQPIGVWSSAEVPADDLPGWAVHGHRHHCPTCAQRRRCAAAGHRFGPWFTAGNEGGVALIHRVCPVCGADEAAPANTVPTVAAPAQPLPLPKLAS